MRKKERTRPKTRKPAAAGAAKPVATHSVAVPQLLTLTEAANVARVSAPTIVRAYNAGQLRVFRTPAGGRVFVYADSLSAWIERNSVGGKRGAR